MIPAVVIVLTAGCGGDSPAPEEAPVSAAAEPHPGEAAYIEHCAECHNGGVYKAPHKMFLGMMAPDAILASIDGGIMATQAADLNAAQKEAVAEYLAGRTLDSVAVSNPPPACDNADIDMAQPPAQLGWGIDSNNSRFQPAATGGLTGDEAPGLKLKWAFAYPNAIKARSQPTVAG